MLSTPTRRAALKRIIRSEGGFAVPTVLMAIVIGMGLAGAAVMASIQAQRGTDRDSASKRALAVADAGAELALLRQNKVATSDPLRCVNESSGGDLIAGGATADGWCAQRSGTVQDGSYSYRVRPWSLVGTTQTGTRRELQVVSVGTVDGVSRRVAVTAAAKTGLNVFGGAGAVGLDTITISGSGDIGTPSEPTDASTNGNVITEGGASKLCGHAHVGHGFTFTGNQCTGFGADNTEVNLPDVDPGSAWTTNDNGRFFGLDPKQGSVTWDSTSRTLALDGNGRLTLGGSNYSLCKLDFQGNSQLIVAQGAVVNLFFHSPETCAAATGGSPSDFASQITMSGNPRLNTTSTNAGDLRIMMVGSDTQPTSVTFQGNPSAGGNDFVFYGPKTDVTLQGNPTFRGAVAAKTINVGGSALLVIDDSALNADLSVALNYARGRYVECVGGTMPAAPDESC